MNEKRKDERVNFTSLPESLKNVGIKTSFFNEEISGKTINASKNGLCFETDESNYYDIKENQNIIIIFYPDTIKLKARVIYVKSNGEKCTFGVNFDRTDKEKYHDILLNK
ncbi:MAG: PilZ domain-containing protein [Spirochaetes bacterium]|nr:PilZ domain-containing protein [Spirochaetota bacterium]